MAAGKLSKRARKKQETMERLLAAAWDLYRGKGFDATTVAEITDAADVAKGTFFNYFSSKEEMLPPLAAWRMSKLMDRLSMINGAPASPLARIHLLLRGLADDIYPNHDLALRTIATLLCQQTEPEKPSLALRRILIDLVREAQARGEIRDDVDPRLVCRFLFVGLFSNFWPHSQEGARSEVIGVERVMEILLQGLAGATKGG